MVYSLLADGVLVLHALFIAFVLFGLILTLLGGLLGWAWVRHRTFRWLHLIAIGVVVAQAWLQLVCPLTTLEMWLRYQAGEMVYGGSFIAHWLQSLLFFTAPHWVFVLAYTGFGALVAGSWWWVPPTNSSTGPRGETES